MRQGNDPADTSSSKAREDNPVSIYSAPAINPRAVIKRLLLYGQLIRLNRPVGIWLLLWPTLWALWIAGAGKPPLIIVCIFIAGTVLMRSAGCAINDYADRNFDRHVARTRERPVTSGRIAAWEALLVTLILSILAFLLIIPLNRLTQGLALVAALLAASYPFTKRFFALPQAYLGVAFGFGIPMAFAAIQNHIPPVAWLLFAANLFWTIAYDTEYAMVDRKDDVHLGIKTAAITFGRFEIYAIMLSYLCALLLLALVGKLTGRGWIYAAGLCGATLVAGYHYTLIRTRQPQACFKAFLHNQWLGALIFTAIASDYAL